MKKITIFCLPKPFEGHIGVIQHNALASWITLQAECDILLIGDESGVAQAAKQYGFRHFPEIRRNEQGTPLVNDIWDIAERESDTDLLCYINADIILLESLDLLADKIRLNRYLAVGYRWNLDIKEPIDFSDPLQLASLKEQLHDQGEIYPDGIDYFLFTKGLFGKIPDFAIGRSVWDNWLIYRALSKAPVVNVSNHFQVIHQNHPYPLGLRSQDNWAGQEAIENLRLAGDLEYCFTIRDADWVLQKDALVKPDQTIKNVILKITRLPVLHENLRFVGPVLKLITQGKVLIRKCVRKIRSVTQIN